MFEKAKDVGLTPQHVADYVKVTRITASGWFNGHAKPHKILEDRMKSFFSALESAISCGALPPPADVGQRKKRKYIRDVLRNAAQRVNA